MMNLKDRVVEFKRIAAVNMLDNDGNWREHPQAQRHALRSVVDEIGIAGALLAYYSERNDMQLTIIDGHLRKGEYPDVEWPVLILDVNDQEADTLLATVDPIAAMAQANQVRLAELRARLEPQSAALKETLEAVARQVGDTPLKTMQRREQGYNASHREMDPIKLAHRIEAIWQAPGGLAIDLFSGKGGLAFWYKRRFERVITIDKAVDGVDYLMTVNQFIKNHLVEFIDFDFVDFDDEGSPAREITLFFETITGRRDKPFYLALTDGNGLNLKIQNRFDFSLYRQGDKLRKGTSEDYTLFEDIVAEFLEWRAKEAGFTPTMLSNYRGREGNVVFQTWLIEP